MHIDTDTAEQAAPALTQSTTHIPWGVLSPGFWQCWRAIRRFKRYQNLVIHHERWASRIDTAPPLENLIGKKAAKQNSVVAIEIQMNKLAIPVMRDMARANVLHTVAAKDNPKQIYSLIADFLTLPDSWHQRKFNMLMQQLDRVIGLYEQRRAQAVRNWFNPLFWMACVVRMPEIIFEHAGLIRTSEQHSAFLGVYKWFVRVVFLVALTIGVTWIAKKLGLNLPWDLLTKVLSS